MAKPHTHEHCWHISARNGGGNECCRCAQYVLSIPYANAKHSTLEGHLGPHVPQLYASQRVSCVCLEVSHA